uniref:Uncharacterized protein n=1 Tax=Globodera pallida TaxID=36090 RepID=A0A183BWD9_GLOPA
MVRNKRSLPTDAPRSTSLQNSDGLQDPKKSRQTESQDSLAEKLKSKELVYEAKMKIHERLKELGLPVQHAPTRGSSSSDRFRETVLKPEEASAFTQLHMEKVQKIQRLNEAKSRISKNAMTLNLKTPSLILDTLTADKQMVAKRELSGLVKPVLEKAESSIELKKSSSSSSMAQQTEPDSSTSALLQEFLDPRIK